MTVSSLQPVRTVRLADVIPDHPSNSVVPFYLDDRRLRIAVARVGDDLYAFDDLCTCAGQSCPLSGGMLIGTTLMCQCHGSEFDVSTGAVISGPATKPLRLYEVHGVGSDRNIRYPAHSGDGQAARRSGLLVPAVMTVLLTALALPILRMVRRQRGGIGRSGDPN